ncbi:presenilin family intramembrane aspartyl protease PSH [Methanoregula sp.]|uniref:presenilin family intramembrane aspartyl protease PSH n=1 Tax=Methanoregula sp. TaxID=2052170 RepID=UPI002C190021|nr:presenilin family intramembrane aspartyl protease PSH [Methanoregula sp.]HVP97111.1 presenilin family intramembrane aspartyl protease PSH [Methanoregula sp.]
MDTTFARLKDALPLLVMPIFLIVVELGALLLAAPVQSAGLVAFQDPESVANPFIFLAMILGFTIVILILIKYALKKLIAAIIGLSIFFTFCFVFAALVYGAMNVTAAGTGAWWEDLVPAVLVYSTTASTIVATALVLILATFATLLLYKYPEWYVIDLLGILLAAGVSAIFGASLDILPVVLLLLILAVYDAISVYKTKHMITLAEGVMDLKTPILFVIPKKRDYSFIKEGIGKISEGGERSAFIIGMGDFIMPSILVVSAGIFTHGTKYFGILNLPVLGAIVGSICGLVVLLYFVMSGKPQAGLPPLNGGTILGFIIGWALIGFA